MQPKHANSRNFLHSRQPGYAKDAGFTLIELMVTVVIIGVMVGIAGISFVDMQRDTDFDSTYNFFRNSFARCRAESFNSPYGVTLPTTLVVYTNGYACVAWNDLNSDRNVGNKGAAPNAGGDLAGGDAAGEILQVFFQQRFERGEAISTAGLDTFIDFGHAWGQLPVDGDPTSGYAFVYSPTGYLLAPDRTLRLGGTTTQARIVLNRTTRNASGVGVLPSGQVIGGSL